jgi:hypothetical protein
MNQKFRFFLFNLLLALIPVLSVVTTAKAQLDGCTDPLALNFNASANINNGSCIYDTISISPTSSFILDSVIKETSGLIQWNSHLWTQNDDTDTAIYALDTLNGSITQSVPLSGVVNTDWEELSQDSLYIYVGDFGNNSNGNRSNLKILRITKNSILANSPVIDTIHFSYSNQTDFTATGGNNTNFDCEAFIVKTDSIFLFTKQWINHKTTIYALPKMPGTYTANLKDSLDVQGLITGATSLNHKNLIVLSGYTNSLEPFIYLLYDYTGTNYFSGNKRKILLSLPYHQVEGITTIDGLTYYITNEHFAYPPFIDVPQQLHQLNLSSYLGGFINDVNSGIKVYDTVKSFSIYPNPTTNQLTITLKAADIGTSYTVTDQLGKVVLSGKLNAVNSIVLLNDVANGMYTIRIGDDFKERFKIIKN